MVEKPRRAEVEERRPDAETAWEVFARNEDGDPVRYVGEVRAENAEDAHAEATRLFCWYAHELWVCPSDEIRRFSADAASSEDDGEATPVLATPEIGGEERTREP
ncbi:Htur_1727 family rSAM-partnered candidate RiPP [Halorussus litoreus]|uniref:Htur_1727 family rSAM-partnered candidate RiPP n=1 Tax=Halorussus litoreus TaxID=1710536 RepID=UPI000E223DC5|nr:Htur_1727 family rSAM-partnered candidate RiPP [Halorussus litoreus]